MNSKENVCVRGREIGSGLSDNLSASVLNQYKTRSIDGSDPQMVISRSFLHFSLL